VALALLLACGIQSPVAAQQAGVIVIGAGVAGLAAAKKLQSEGWKVIVLEASNRTGRLHNRV
jgi:monoamine oxidase